MSGAISSFDKTVFQLIPSADICKPPLASTCTFNVLIVTTVFAVNHAYVDAISKIAINNNTKSDDLKFSFFLFFPLFDICFSFLLNLVNRISLQIFIVNKI